MHKDWLDPTENPFEFRDDETGINHPVHSRGDGPPILILQELPGIGRETFDLADLLIENGFKVYLPDLFGTFGQTERGALKNLRRLICIRHEFQVWRTGRQSSIANWMRKLCAEIQTREDGQRLGVIGMCLTGSFAIPLMAEDAVQAAVASQPSVPKPILFDRLHMSPSEVDRACRAMETKGTALAMRYKNDKISTAAQMQTLKSAFGPHLEVEEYDDPPGHTGNPHALLTLHPLPEAFDRTLEYFKDRFGLA